MSSHSHSHFASNIASRRNCHRLPSRQQGASQHERARVVARLVAAERALPADPDRAALLLDGALAELLGLWARDKRPSPSGALDAPDPLGALDVAAPAAAWRVRLALQAHEPSARLAHCWALLDLLASTTRRRRTTTYTSLHASQRDTSRTNGASHVS